MRWIAAIAVLASSLLFACETPRERACRSLTLQARDAEDARTATSPDPRVAAYRAQSAARWLRSNAVDDAALKQDVDDLASALDRLADARSRIAVARDALGAHDAADLVARSEKVLAYVADFEKVRSKCRGLDGVSLAQQADQCAMRLDETVDAEAIANLKTWATWAETLERRPLQETLAQARGVHTVIADRGRAEADVTRLVASIGTKCGS